MMRKIPNITITSLLAGTLAIGGLTLGCATGGANEPREVDGRTGQMQQVRYGRLVQVEEVEIDNPEGYEGALIGATLGGLAGVAIGDNTKGRVAGGAIGAILGGVTGNKVQEELRDDGYEYTVELDSGNTVSVIEVDERPLRQGQRVKIVERGDTVSITPAA